MYFGQTMIVEALILMPDFWGILALDLILLQDNILL